MIYVLWLVLDSSSCRGGFAAIWLYTFLCWVWYCLIHCCPGWPSRDVKVMFYNLFGDVRSPFVLFTTKLIQNYCSQTKFSYSLRVVWPGRLYIVSVRDRLSSSSDLLKSWGGGVWRSRVEYVCRVVYLSCTVCYCPCHLWRALPCSAAPTVCIRLAGSLPIECCARSHMGSLYSVSERRGSIYVICTTGHSFML